MNDGTQGITPAILFKKLREFVESVFPLDPGQAALLFGAVLMLGIPHMHSWLAWLYRMAHYESAATATHVNNVLTAPLYLIYVAGAVALWVGLVEVSQPQRWLRIGVFAPFWFGLGVNLILGWYFQNRYSEVPLVAGSAIARSSPFIQLFGRLPGHTFNVELLAWLMILIAYKRLDAGKMTLPVRFPTAENDTPGAAQTSAKLIWSTLVVTSLVALAISRGIAVFVPYRVSSTSSYELEWPQAALWNVDWGLGFAAIVWFACGRDRLATFSRILRLPHVKWIALSIVLPLVVASAVPLGTFVLYRVRGAAHFPGDYRPELSDHFPPFVWISLFLIASALAEEIAWRGYLQPKFIRRFGLYRGIFLVGIVWGAFHFPWNFSGKGNLAYLSLEILERLLNCVAWGFVLSWLTLKAKSVIPAGITHGLANALWFLNWDGGNSVWTVAALWGALAFVLFRFWSPEIEDESTAPAPPSDELRGSDGVVKRSAEGLA